MSFVIWKDESTVDTVLDVDTVKKVTEYTITSKETVNGNAKENKVGEGSCLKSNICPYECTFWFMGIFLQREITFFILYKHLHLFIPVLSIFYGQYVNLLGNEAQVLVYSQTSLLGCDAYDFGGSVAWVNPTFTSFMMAIFII